MLLPIMMFVMNVRYSRLVEFQKWLPRINGKEINYMVINAYETGTDVQTVSQMNINSTLNFPNIGVILAHKLVYSRAKENSLTLIVEDDINIKDQELEFIFHDLEKFLNSDCDIYYFATRRDLYFRDAYWENNGLLQTNFNYTCHGTKPCWFSTLGFALKYSSVQKLKNLITFTLPIDVHIGSLVFQGHLKACLSSIKMLEEVSDHVHDTIT